MSVEPRDLGHGSGQIDCQHPRWRGISPNASAPRPADFFHHSDQSLNLMKPAVAITHRLKARRPWVLAEITCIMAGSAIFTTRSVRPCKRVQVHRAWSISPLGKAVDFKRTRWSADKNQSASTVPFNHSLLTPLSLFRTSRQNFHHQLLKIFGMGCYRVPSSPTPSVETPIPEDPAKEDSDASWLIFVGNVSASTFPQHGTEC